MLRKGAEQVGRWPVGSRESKLSGLLGNTAHEEETEDEEGDINWAGQTGHPLHTALLRPSLKRSSVYVLVCMCWCEH